MTAAAAMTSVGFDPDGAPSVRAGAELGAHPRARPRARRSRAAAPAGPGPHQTAGV
jgi:hypothetical protein